uniref:Uncharacterized protein n=1 Tax=Poecilia latipinna TaxID=48699 RepID=A0A3B3VBG1_9TELE
NRSECVRVCVGMSEFKSCQNCLDRFSPRESIKDSLHLWGSWGHRVPITHQPVDWERSQIILYWHHGYETQDENDENVEKHLMTVVKYSGLSTVLWVCFTSQSPGYYCVYVRNNTNTSSARNLNLWISMRLAKHLTLREEK